jgi:hypothetical protein
VVGQLGVAAIEQRIVQVRMQDAAFEVIEVLCPAGLCGREPNPELAIGRGRLKRGT